MKFRGKVCAVLATFWAAFIFSNSLKIAEESDAMSNPIVDTVAKWLSDIGVSVNIDTLTFLIRKSAHFTEYMILGILIAFVFVGMSKRLSFYWSHILFLCLASGVIDEMIQFFVPGRSSEVRDILIDFAGGLLGYIIVSIIQSVRHRKKRYGKYKRLQY